MDKKLLAELDACLCDVVGALQQESDKRARILVGVAASKISAAAILAGTTGAIGTFGVASTGTAIASLSGAAATSATLYWVGSSVGLGMAAGGVILTGFALGLAVPSAWYVRRHVFGRPRSGEEMSDKERAVLYAAMRLATALRLELARGAVPTRGDMLIVAQSALVPLVDRLSALSAGANGQRTLAMLPKRRLSRAVVELSRLSKELKAA